MRVVVIGAGLAGLATALRLARGGCAVTVLEAAGEVGGRARSTVHAAHILNLGPHALYPDAIAELADLGVHPSMHTPLVSSRLFQRGALVSALSLARLAPWLAGLAFRDPRRLEGVTVAAWLGAELSGISLELATALIRVSSYTDRRDLDAAAALRQLKLVGGGVRYVDGGWQSLVDALVAAATAEGVAIRTGAAVRAIEGARVVLRGEVVDADAVVVAASADRARRLIPELPALESAHASCLDVALSRLPQRAPGFVLGIDEPLYLSVHSLSAALGPGAIVHVAAYGGAPRDTLEHLLDRAQPGWRERVVHARFLPRMAVMHGIPVVGAERPVARIRPGVVLAGDYVGDGMLAGAALSSARRAADALLSDRAELAA